MKINISTTEIMKIGNTEKKTSIKINNEILEQMNLFKNLEVKVHSGGDTDHKINKIINNVILKYHIEKKNFLREREGERERERAKQKNKGVSTQYNIIYVPILTFASESWALIKAHGRKLQEIALKYFRRVKDVTRSDK